MAYKWKPNAAQKAAYKEKMQEKESIIFKNDIMPEKKIVSVKTYTVTFRECEDGTMDMHRVNDGFNTLELLGLIDFIGFEIREQSVGRLQSNKVKRDVVVP